MQTNKLIVWKHFPFAYCDIRVRRQFGEWITYYEIRQRDLVISYETMCEIAAWENAADRIQLGDFN